MHCSLKIDNHSISTGDRNSHHNLVVVDPKSKRIIMNEILKFCLHFSLAQAPGEKFDSRRELWTLIGTADYSYHLFAELLPEARGEPLIFCFVVELFRP